MKALIASVFTLCSLTTSSQEIQSVYAKTEVNNISSLYSETYSSPFFSKPVNFQRLYEEFRNANTILPNYTFISLDQYAEPDTINVAAELGARKPFGINLVSVFSIRVESLNKKNEENFILKGGLVYNKFSNLDFTKVCIIYALYATGK